MNVSKGKAAKTKKAKTKVKAEVKAKAKSKAKAKAKATKTNTKTRVKAKVKVKVKAKAKVKKAEAKTRTITKTKVKAAKAKTKVKGKRKQQPRKWPKIPKKEFDRFHLDMPVPTNGVRTSKQAAESIKDDTSRLRRLVWSTIYLHNGLICDEVEVITNLKHQTASARIYELHQRGWLVDSGYRRRTRSRCLAIVWIPPKRLKILRRLVKEKKVKVVETKEKKAKVSSRERKEK